MSEQKRNKAVARHMTAEEKKAVIAVKRAVNSLPFFQRLKYALRIIARKW